MDNAEKLINEKSEKIRAAPLSSINDQFNVTLKRHLESIKAISRNATQVVEMSKSINGN